VSIIVTAMVVIAPVNMRVRVAAISDVRPPHVFVSATRIPMLYVAPVMSVGNHSGHVAVGVAVLRHCLALSPSAVGDRRSVGSVDRAHSTARVERRFVPRLGGYGGGASGLAYLAGVPSRIRYAPAAIRMGGGSGMPPDRRTRVRMTGGSGVGMPASSRVGMTGGSRV